MLGRRVPPIFSFFTPLPTQAYLQNYDVNFIVPVWGVAADQLKYLAKCHNLVMLCWSF